jgi:hypothetical protein
MDQIKSFERMRIFEKVRDIPYRIPLNLKEKDNTCSGKSRKLFKLLSERGYKVRYRVGICSWDAFPLPKEIKEIPHDKKTMHSYVEIFLEGKWIILDTTWDKKLKKILFVNDWDGKSNTKLGFKITKLFGPKKSIRLMEHDTSKKKLEVEFKRNRKFYKAINLWLAKVRKTAV